MITSRTKRRLRRKAVLLFKIIVELAFIMLAIAAIILGFRFARNRISASNLEKEKTDVANFTYDDTSERNDGLQNIEIKEAHVVFSPIGINAEVPIENNTETTSEIETTTQATTTYTTSIITTTTTEITTIVSQAITTTTEISTTVSTTATTSKDATAYFSSYEIRLFASLIEAEGGIAPKITRERIGISCINRVESEYFPNSIEGVIEAPNQYETYIKGLLPENPTEENMEIAKEIMGLFYTDSWSEYCISKNLSAKTVFQANSCVDQSSYAYTILDEYGLVGSYEYHMVYGESKYDYSEVPYSYDYVGDYAK